VQRVARIGLAVIEITTLSVLILAARCANYQDVFVARNVYFTDADCYARMCERTPGVIVRHHDFENFPGGTTPHTTAPLDYLILALSILLKPFTTHAFDLAGAFISPLLALLAGWFLWWWSRQTKFRYGWVMLILYAISPILVHGTELGRPDHQSLLMLLVTIAIWAEWILQCDGARAIEVNSRKVSEWSILSGIAWGLAIWISAYESLALFFITIVVRVLQDRKAIFAKKRHIGWLCFGLIVATALLIEQRVPAISIFRSNEILENWARTIGELAHVSPGNPIWLRWAGYLLLVAPFLIWFGLWERESKSTSKSTRETTPLFIIVLLIATYLLTIWQARWAYFFVLIFAIALPALLEPIESRAAVSIAFILSIFPVLRDWDARLWPNEAELVRRMEQRNESMQLRDLAINLRSPVTQPFLSPWWLSPAIAYWVEATWRGWKLAREPGRN
jgi:asparagine N-glycosylation enzyme membrane subunit Stt3